MGFRDSRVWDLGFLPEVESGAGVGLYPDLNMAYHFGSWYIFGPFIGVQNLRHN